MVQISIHNKRTICATDITTTMATTILNDYERVPKMAEIMARSDCNGNQCCCQFMESKYKFDDYDINNQSSSNNDAAIDDDDEVHMIHMDHNYYHQNTIVACRSDEVKCYRMNENKCRRTSDRRTPVDWYPHNHYLYDDYNNNHLDNNEDEPTIFKNNNRRSSSSSSNNLNPSALAASGQTSTSSSSTTIMKYLPSLLLIPLKCYYYYLSLSSTSTSSWYLWPSSALSRWKYQHKISLQIDANHHVDKPNKPANRQPNIATIGSCHCSKIITSLLVLLLMLFININLVNCILVRGDGSEFNRAPSAPVKGKS